MSRALNGKSTLVSLARADGITRALIYPSPSRAAPLSGEPSFARLRDGVNILDRANVAVYVVIGGGAWDRIGGRGQQWMALRKMLADAKREAARPTRKKDRRGGGSSAGSGDPPGGPGLPDGEMAIRDVVAGKVPLAIQTNRESDIREAAQLAREFDLRVIIVGGAQAWRAADVLAAAKVAVVLDPQANLPFVFDLVGTREDSIVILKRAGVPVAIGMAGGVVHMTYNAGMALREGAGLAVANGLSYAEALRAVTVDPLAIWGRGGGTLTQGADADLVVWDGDPLEPSTNAVNVIIEGRQASTRSRQDMLAERYRDAGK
jgi:imidazolonepropionase-like amidohydrolase